METPVSTYDIPLWFSLVHQQGSEGSVVKLIRLSVLIGQVRKTPLATLADVYQECLQRILVLMAGLRKLNNIHTDPVKWPCHRDRNQG